MKELRFKQNNPSLGEIHILMRIIGRTIYFKTNNNQYSDQMLKQLAAKGAVILRGNGGWLRIDIFPRDMELAKLGRYEINFNEDSEEDQEIKIGNFYSEKYVEAGFSLE